MQQEHKNTGVKIAITGFCSAPKIFSALQVAYGLTGKWESILLLTSSSKSNQYQHIGGYCSLSIPRDASPQRYYDTLNLIQACGVEVVILANLSDEWREGVASHLSSSCYEDLLKAHRELFQLIRALPVHIIACIDSTRKMSLEENDNGKHRLSFKHQLIQQEGIERYFTSILQVNKKGMALAVKDMTTMLPCSKRIKVTPQIGALLFDWCKERRSVVSEGLQQMIDGCTSIGELYELLFDLDIDDLNLLNAFTKRRLELDGSVRATHLEVMRGGLNE